MSEATMTPTKAMAITREPERYTVQERKDAKKVLAKIGSQGADFTENPKNAPVSMPKPRPKNAIARERAMSKGGMPKKYNKGGYANCGASMSPTQSSSKKMMGGGYASKKM